MTDFSRLDFHIYLLYYDLVTVPHDDKIIGINSQLDRYFLSRTGILKLNMSYLFI